MTLLSIPLSSALDPQVGRELVREIEAQTGLAAQESHEGRALHTGRLLDRVQ